MKTFKQKYSLKLKNNTNYGKLLVKICRIFNTKCETKISLINPKMASPDKQNEGEKVISVTDTDFQNLIASIVNKQLEQYTKVVAKLNEPAASTSTSDPSPSTSAASTSCPPATTAPIHKPATKRKAHVVSDEATPKKQQCRDAVTDFFEEEEKEEEKASAATDGEEDWMGAFEKELGQRDETGPGIEPKLATLVNKLFTKKSEEEVIKGLLNKFPKPENVPQLIAQRVNPIVWGKLSNTTKRKDLRISTASNKIIKSSTASVNIVQKLTELKNDTKDPKMKAALKEIAISTMQAVQINAAAVHELAQVRRDQMKGDLNNEYSDLFNTPETEDVDLVGKNVAAKIKDINEANKMRLQIERHTQRPGNESKSMYVYSMYFQSDDSSWEVIFII